MLTAALPVAFEPAEELATQVQDAIAERKLSQGALCSILALFHFSIVRGGAWRSEAPSVGVRART